MMLPFSAHPGYLFTDLTLEQRFQAARKAGFDRCSTTIDGQGSFFALALLDGVLPIHTSFREELRDCLSAESRNRATGVSSVTTVFVNSPISRRSGPGRPCDRTSP